MNIISMPIDSIIVPDRRRANAVRLVKSMIKSGDLPLTLNPQEITDLDMQISGTDILVTSNIRIQVKCDFNGGRRELGGTGNLFLQVAECNPFRRI